MYRRFIGVGVGALLLGGAHRERAPFHNNHIKTHAIHLEGLIRDLVAATTTIDDKIHERGNVGHIHFAVGVDIRHRALCPRPNDLIHQGSDVGHIRRAVAIHIAGVFNHRPGQNDIVGCSIVLSHRHIIESCTYPPCRDGEHIAAEGGLRFVRLHCQHIAGSGSGERNHVGATLQRVLCGNRYQFVGVGESDIDIGKRSHIALGRTHRVFQ